jgi:hypothetical protein
LEAPIVFWGEGSGQVAGALREILAEDKLRLHGITLRGQIAEQTTEEAQLMHAREIGQARRFLTEAAKPANHVRVAAQFGELA